MARNYRVTGRTAQGAAVAKIRVGVTRTLISGEAHALTDREADAARAIGLQVEPEVAISSEIGDCDANGQEAEETKVMTDGI